MIKGRGLDSGPAHSKPKLFSASGYMESVGANTALDSHHHRLSSCHPPGREEAGTQDMGTRSLKCRGNLSGGWEQMTTGMTHVRDFNLSLGKGTFLTTPQLIGIEFDKKLKVYMGN